MKLAAPCLMTFLLALAAAPVNAAEADTGAIVRISAVTSPRLNLYARDAVDSKLKDVPKESVAMPLEVSETAQDEKFLKVKIDGDTVWVRRVQVSVLRTVTAGCLAQATAPQDAAATRGANRGCGK